MQVSKQGGWLVFNHAPPDIYDKLCSVKSAQSKRGDKTVVRVADTQTARLSIQEKLGHWVDLGMTEQQRQLIRPALEHLPPPDFIPAEAYPSWPWQVEGFWRVVRNDATMLAMGMGTGKTKVVIEAIRFSGAKKSLVVCLKTKVNDWVKEFDEWESGVLATPLWGSSTERTRDAIAAIEDPPAVLVVNIDSVWRDPLGTWLLSQEWDFLAVDENQSIRSPSGVASKFMADLGHRAKCRVVLSGTPMAHSPVDIFAQYRILDPAIFGTVFENFRDRYVFTQNPDGTGKVLGYTEEEELSAKYHSIAYEVPRSVLGLEKPQEVTLSFELNSDERREYDRMEAELVAYAEDATITAANLGVRMGKLQQIAGGFVIDSDTKEVHEIGRSKFERFEDWLEEVDGEPFVAFCRFSHQVRELVRICEAKGVTAAEMSGRLNQYEEWQSGSHQALICQHRTGGVGVNLTRACIGVYFSIEWSLNTYDQSMCRLDRPGQTRPVTYYHFPAWDTVETDLYEGLAKKRDIIQHILSLARGRMASRATS